MVLVEARQLIAPPQIKQAVADADPRKARAQFVRREVGRDQRRAHALVHRLLVGLLGERAVGRFEVGHEALHEAVRVGDEAAREGARERGAGDAGGHGTADVPAHTVAEHGEQVPVRQRRRFVEPSHDLARPEETGVLLVASGALGGADSGCEGEGQSGVRIPVLVGGERRLGQGRPFAVRDPTFHPLHDVGSCPSFISPRPVPTSRSPRRRTG